MLVLDRSEEPCLENLFRRRPVGWESKKDIGIRTTYITQQAAILTLKFPPGKKQQRGKHPHCEIVLVHPQYARLS